MSIWVLAMIEYTLQSAQPPASDNPNLSQVPARTSTKTYKALATITILSTLAYIVHLIVFALDKIY